MRRSPAPPPCGHPCDFMGVCVDISVVLLFKRLRMACGCGFPVRPPPPPPALMRVNPAVTLLPVSVSPLFCVCPFKCENKEQFSSAAAPAARMEVAHVGAKGVTPLSINRGMGGSGVRWGAQQRCVLAAALLLCSCIAAVNAGALLCPSCSAIRAVAGPLSGAQRKPFSPSNFPVFAQPIGHRSAV